MSQAMPDIFDTKHPLDAGGHADLMLSQNNGTADHYSKRSEPMLQEQSYPPINPVEVEHFDKDSERAKDHDVSPDIKAQIRELKASEEELLSGINKSDAPSNQGKKKE